MTPIHRSILRFVIMMAILAVVVTSVRTLQTNRRLMDRLDRYETTYRIVSHGDHTFATFDGGMAWYVVQRTSREGPLDILGRAEHVAPEAWTAYTSFRDLTAYVERHGPINPATMTTEEQSLLEGIGLTIRTSP